MSIDKSPARLLSRARALSESIETPSQRLHWERQDIDAIGEAACMLHEKGLSSIDDKALLLDWEIQFCKIFASLAYWRGHFSLSWACSERLVKLLKTDPARQAELGLALARAGAAASHYAHFDADYAKQRLHAFDRAEHLFKLALPYCSAPPTGLVFAGLPLEAYVLYEASRHWHFCGLQDLSRLSMDKAYELAPEACARAANGDEAPQFWQDLHLGGLWTQIAKRS